MDPENIGKAVFSVFERGLVKVILVALAVGVALIFAGYAIGHC